MDSIYFIVYQNEKILFALCAILWSTVVLAQVQARSNGFVVTVKGVVVKVEFYTPNIVRVSKTLESGNVNLRKSLAVVLELLRLKSMFLGKTIW